MVDPRDKVRRTLEFDAPAGIPRHLWTLPWAEKNHPEALRMIREEFPDDLVTVPDPYRNPLPGEGDPHRPGAYADGGVIAQCEFGPGARPENVVEVFRSRDAQFKNDR